jgi:hypothetical protein
MQMFMRMMNKFPAMLLRSPLHGLLSKGIVLITFTGHTSGKRYTTPINYVREGDTVLITIDSTFILRLTDSIDSLDVQLRREFGVLDDREVGQLEGDQLSQSDSQAAGCQDHRARRGGNQVSYLVPDCV